MIRQKYPGRWQKCLRDHAPLTGGRVWYDEYLFRDAAMNPADIEDLVQHWSALGFEPFEVRDGQKIWKDVCVVEAMFSEATLPCSSVTVDKKNRIAYLVGTEPGRVIGRNNVTSLARGPEQSARQDRGHEPRLGGRTGGTATVEHRE